MEEQVWFKNQLPKMMLKTSKNLPKENWMIGPYFFDSCRITLCSKGLVYTAILRMKMSNIILLNK